MNNILIIGILIAVVLGGLYVYSAKEKADRDPATVETESESRNAANNQPEAAPTTNTAPDPAPAANPVVSPTTDDETDTVVETETEPEVAVDPEPTNTSHVFDIAGVNYAFDVKQMRVQEGDTVTVNFVSDEGFHDWVVDEFSAATEKVRPGTPTSVTFVASKAGTYEYYCSVGSHRAQGMVGTLIVE